MLVAVTAAGCVGGANDEAGAAREPLTSAAAPTRVPTEAELLAMGALSPVPPPPPDFAAMRTVEATALPSAAATAPPRMSGAELASAARAVGAEVVVASATSTDLDWTSDVPLAFAVRASIGGDLPAGTVVEVERQRTARGAFCECARLHVRGGRTYLLVLVPAVGGRYRIVDTPELPNAWGEVDVDPDGRVLAELASGRQLDLSDRLAEGSLR